MYFGSAANHCLVSTTPYMLAIHHSANNITCSIYQLQPFRNLFDERDFQRPKHVTLYLSRCEIYSTSTPASSLSFVFSWLRDEVLTMLKIGDVSLWQGWALRHGLSTNSRYTILASEAWHTNNSVLHYRISRIFVPTNVHEFRWVDTVFRGKLDRRTDHILCAKTNFTCCWSHSIVILFDRFYSLHFSTHSSCFNRLTCLGVHTYVYASFVLARRSLSFSVRLRSVNSTASHFVESAEILTSNHVKLGNGKQQLLPWLLLLVQAAALLLLADPPCCRQ